MVELIYEDTEHHKWAGEGWAQEGRRGRKGRYVAQHQSGMVKGIPEVGWTWFRGLWMMNNEEDFNAENSARGSTQAHTAVTPESHSIPWLNQKRNNIEGRSIFIPRNLPCRLSDARNHFWKVLPLPYSSHTVICHPLSPNPRIFSAGCEDSPDFYALLAFCSFEHGPSRLDRSRWASLCVNVLKTTLIVPSGNIGRVGALHSTRHPTIESQPHIQAACPVDPHVGGPIKRVGLTNPLGSNKEPRRKVFGRLRTIVPFNLQPHLSTSRGLRGVTPTRFKEQDQNRERYWRTCQAGRRHIQLHR